MAGPLAEQNGAGFGQLAQAKQEGAAQRREELEQVRKGLMDMKKEWEAWLR